VKKKQQSQKKLVITFFIGFIALMSSLIYFSTTVELGSDERNNSSIVSKTFSEELKIAEEKSIQRKAENEGKWKPSNQFVMTAMIIASILDIVIILLWARHENKKRKGTGEISTHHWTNKKWFWNLVSMGIVGPVNGKIVLNKKNLVIVIILLIALKFALSKKLESAFSPNNLLTF
jgi:hypothetical protein